MRRKSPKPIPTPAGHQELPSYALPALDSAFLLGDSMRGVRFLLEYAKAEEHLRAAGIHSTIVCFGSARTEPAHRWYKAAREFGRLASIRGGACDSNGKERFNVIATGGGPGTMEAANRGAADAGAPSIGFNIRLPHEQEPNPYSTPELTFQFHYFAMRKMHLAMRANGLVVFPGGFGTLDEFLEALTLIQTGKMKPIPLLLFGRDYWSRIIDFEQMAAEGVINYEDLELFDWVETAEEAWARIVDFYDLDCG